MMLIAPVPSKSPSTSELTDCGRPTLPHILTAPVGTPSNEPPTLVVLAVVAGVLLLLVVISACVIVAAFALRQRHKAGL